MPGPYRRRSIDIGLQAIKEIKRVAVNREKLLWYGNRLRSMPSKEILHRLREAYQQRRSAPEVSTPSRPRWTSNDETMLRLIDSWQSFWSDEVAEHCGNTAGKTVAGGISVFGHDWSTETKDWMVDPVTGYSWPSVPAHKIDYRHADGADPKWTWEVNRLLFLVPVAFAVETDSIERSAAEEFISATLTDWIERCRFGYGPQWSASIEVAIRSITMTLALQSLGRPSGELLDAVGTSVREHAAWIKRFPSAYSSANNHRVAELAAVLILDSSWTGILEPGEGALLEQELHLVSRRLFSSDGIGLEQSPTYGAFSMEFLALALKCRRWEDPKSRRGVSEIMSSAAQALAELTYDDGSLIRYGDDDEGKILTVAVPDGLYAKSIVRMAIGDDGVRHQGLITFSQGGVSLLRFIDCSFETTWLFDHGPLGFGEIAAHGHADVLSVSLRSAGADWIVDAGTYRYHGDKSWRTYFRSSRAHNAPQLGEIDSSVMTGDFNWHPQKRAEGRLIISETDGTRARLSATHDGYQKLRMGQPMRTLERISEANYRITDEYDGPHQLSTSFMLHPDCEVSSTASGWRISRSDSTLTIEISASGHTELTLEAPQDRTAWFSPAFGKKFATWRVGARCSVQASEGQLLNFDFKFSNHSPLEA